MLYSAGKAVSSHLYEVIGQWGEVRVHPRCPMCMLMYVSMPIRLGGWLLWRLTVRLRTG